jgi:general secretion pathway protein G
MYRSFQADRTGFSVIEFCAVSTIVAILAAIVVPRVVVDEKVAQQKIRDHHAAAINVALERYHARHGCWPESLENLASDPELFPNGIPNDPLTGRPFAIDPATRRVQ